jgi:hypothetical protein
MLQSSDKSRRHTLKGSNEMITPIHKSTVKAMLRKGKTFKGYIAPCNVNRANVNGMWHIGMPVKFTSIEEMEEIIRDYSYYNCCNELGNRVRFWA